MGLGYLGVGEPRGLLVQPGYVLLKYFRLHDGAEMSSEKFGIQVTRHRETSKRKGRWVATEEDQAGHPTEFSSALQF